MKPLVVLSQRAGPAKFSSLLMNSAEGNGDAPWEIPAVDRDLSLPEQLT